MIRLDAVAAADADDFGDLLDAVRAELAVAEAR